MAPLHSFRKKAVGSTRPADRGTSARFHSRKLSSPTALREEVVDQQLKNIYQDAHGRPKDMRRLDQKRSGTSLTRFTFFVSVIAVAVAGAWYAYQTFGGGGGRFGEEQVDMAIQIPKTVTAGGKTTVDIEVNNRGSAVLTNLDLLLQAPDGFKILESSQPSEGDQNRRWKLADLSGGSRTTIQLKGVFWAPVPSRQEIRASLMFQPEGLRASFRVTKTAETEVAASVVSMVVKAPDKLALGQKGSWDIELTTTETDPVAGLSVSIVPPPQFLLESSTPPAKTTAGIEWDAVMVSAAAKVVLHIEGTFVDTATDVLSSPGGTQDRSFKVRLLNGNNFDRQTILEQTITASVTQSAFFIRLKANESLSQVSIQPPGTARLSLEVVNKGVDPVTDVSVIVRLASSQQVADLVELSAIKGTPTPTVMGATVLWDKKLFEKLSFIRGGDTVALSAELPIRSEAVGSIDTSAVATFTSSGTQKSVESNTTTIQLAPLLDGQAQSRYYTDDNLAFGTGPVPPRVGSKTIYAVFLTLSKRSGQYSNVVWSLPLAKGVEYATGSSTAGTVSFDALTRSVQWRIPELPESLTGISGDIRVSVTPTADDVGKVLDLTGNSRLTAVDTKSRAAVERVLPTRTTTNIESDPQVAGRGAVVGQ